MKRRPARTIHRWLSAPLILAAVAFAVASCEFSSDDECSTDFDCADGAFCSFTEDGCSAGGAVCVFGQSCETTADCSPGQTCVIHEGREPRHPFEPGIADRGFCECPDGFCGGAVSSNVSSVGPSSGSSGGEGGTNVGGGGGTNVGGGGGGTGTNAGGGGATSTSALTGTGGDGGSGGSGGGGGGPTLTGAGGGQGGAGGAR